MLHAPGWFDGTDAGLEPSKRFAGSGESYFMSYESFCLPGLRAINTGAEQKASLTFHNFLF